jgi:tetraprenyl-beta-curcumene synthase
VLRVNAFAAYRGGLDAAFATAAMRYWMSAFPMAHRQIKSWKRQARAIPDPTLRTIALTALGTERGNLEGAAAFGAFVPRAHRQDVIAAAVAFQVVYDYADAIAEQPVGTIDADVRQLHGALLVAVTPDRSQPRYYAESLVDNGYLSRLVACCQMALARLPTASVVLPHTQLAVNRIVDYQDHNHGERHELFVQWAERMTASAGDDLRWWETGAAAGSSLLVFALMAAAADSNVRRVHAETLTDAYFPWIGALHTLLDSAIDLDEDRVTGQHNLIRHYASWDETINRLRDLTDQAVARARQLPDSDQHLLIVAALIGFYLSAPQASEPQLAALREAILSAGGRWAALAMAVQRSNRTVHSWTTLVRLRK